MSKYAKFDRDDVIEKATNLYWEKGFHGTSMRNLQDVVDMRPGSIYASFGSKESLFKETIQYYGKMSRARLKACTEESATPLDALKLFVMNAVIGSKSGPSGMCMLVKTIAELTDDQEEILNEAKRLLSIVESDFAELIQQAIDHGQLDQSSDAKKLASFLQIQIMGLRTYARANPNDETIETVIEDMFTVYPFCR